MERLRNCLRLLAFAIAALACVATSAPRFRYVRAYPMWSIAAQAARTVGCAEVSVWIAKSGKSGVGVSVIAKTKAATCHVAIERLTLHSNDSPSVLAALPPPTTVTNTERVQFYLPLAFDNEASWNRGERAGRLELTLRAGGERAEIQIEARHWRSGPHRAIDRFRKEEPRPPEATPLRTVVRNDESQPLELVPERQ